MSRKIDPENPFDEDTRRYLLDRGRTEEVQANEARFGQAQMSRADRENRMNELRSELRVLQEQNDLEDNPNVYEPTPGATGGVRDGTYVNGRVPEGSPAPKRDDYENAKEWTAAKLKTELGRRNEERKKYDQDPLPLTGTRSELIERLRQDDSEIEDAEVSDSEDAD